ncbi:MAG: iron-containing alcohol dehydrogenase [Candidatus Omnitrophota bacterium]
MQNFTFWNPVKIIFGEGTIPQIGPETKKYGKKALFVYGKSSIKKNGVYDQAVQSLQAAGVEIVEFSGVKPNPVLSHLNEGIALAKGEQADVVVAVGGGSVLDESKAIAAGAKSDGDVWDFFLGKREVEDALPLLTILTLAATGSEMNCGAVVTNEETKQKFNVNSPCLFPKVSILDPTTTCTVPMNYTAYGAVDAIAHSIEGYFTSADSWTPIQDRYVEGLIASIMDSAGRLLKNPADYQGRASMMWAATLALNGLPLAGIGPCGFPNHAIEHSLSALYDIAHGAGLAIVIPGWMKYASQKNPAKFAQFAQRVFHMAEDGSPTQTAAKGIEALKAWFKKIGCPVSLADAHIPSTDIDIIADNATMLAKKWRLNDYTKETIANVLSLCQ